MKDDFDAIKYYVVGNTHRGPAWLKGEEETSELWELFIVRLLDLLDTQKDFKYVLETAYCFRKLEKRRPDLIRRLKVYFEEGRLEFGGGLASNMETNTIGPESVVRNQLLGLKWVKEHLGADVTTGYLIDTFGIHMQIPQILRQFGIQCLLANRLGGWINQDAFITRGLDGTKLKVIGRDAYAPYVAPGVMTFDMVENWQQTEKVIADAAAREGDGPFIVMPYIEGYIPGTRFLELIAKENQKKNGRWEMTLARDFVSALDQSEYIWPEVEGELNPEFTATFSQRIVLKTTNRHVEFLMAEAEKWACLFGLHAWKDKMDEAWWILAFNHVHDMISGSHPTAVFRENMEHFKNAEEVAKEILHRALGGRILLSGDRLDASCLRLYNGLPWRRHDIVALSLDSKLQGVKQIRDSYGDVPFEVKDNMLYFEARIPACGSSSYLIEAGKAREARKREVHSCKIENAYILAEFDDQVGLKRLVWKATGKVLMENAADFLVLQRDTGNYQFENPNGGEIPAAAGSVRLYVYEETLIGQRLEVCGDFPELRNSNPDLDWIGSRKEHYLTWKMEWFLPKGRPLLDLKIKLNWMGESSRVRLKMSTSIKADDGIYEVPYGVVHRRPYGSRMTAKGEWPAYRFVTLEDGEGGLALINTGVPGVEVCGSTLWTTLLRAPASEYAGMVPDDTSSQHGEHEFEFRIVPYSGSWGEANVIRYAQEKNTPVISVECNPEQDGAILTESSPSLELYPENLVLTSVKAPEDGSDEWVIRYYETEGKNCRAKLFVRGAHAAWKSDLMEVKGEKIEVKDGWLETDAGPFEIVTLRISHDRWEKV